MTVAAALAVLCHLCGFAPPQTPPADLKFEVASIRPSAPKTPGVYYKLPGGRFRATGLSVLSLMSYAYDVPETEIFDAPRWADSDKFDVDAVADIGDIVGPPAMLARTKMMVRNLIKERFGLEVHSESRLLPVYVLVPDKGGPKLQHNTEEEYMIRRASGSVTFRKASMANLADFLSRNMRTQIGRAVVDKTDLAGEFDFQLRWAPGPAAQERNPDLPTSIVDAFLPQIGIRLQSEREPVMVLLITRLHPLSAE